MEFVSVLGIAASVANIVELSTTCITSLQALRASYKISELNVQVSVTQLSTLKAVLMQISAWQCEDTESIPSHLGMDLNLSLHSCETLIDSLNGQLNPVRVDQGSRTLSFRGKAKFLWNEREWTNLQTLLDHQITGIHLLLTTMQWYIPSNNSSIQAANVDKAKPGVNRRLYFENRQAGKYFHLHETIRLLCCV